MRNLRVVVMFSRNLARNLSTTAAVNKRVAVLGAAGGIGQPLSLLLKVLKIWNKKLRC